MGGNTELNRYPDGAAVKMGKQKKMIKEILQIEHIHRVKLRETVQAVLERLSNWFLILQSQVIRSPSILHFLF